MMANPLISIVLPTYNGSRYLEQAIQSCLDQTYSHWELIIVDDASTDNTPELISRFLGIDPRIRVVRHETNRKLPAALNTGFAQARGELLTWTSDDNCYRPQALAEMVEFLESHPEINVVYCDYTMIDESGQILHSVKVNDPDHLVICNVVGCCFLYYRNVAEKIGEYSEKLYLAEDYDFWLRAANSFKIAPLHQDLYFYRRHPNTLTALKRNEVIAITEKILAENIPQMDWVNSLIRAKGYFKLKKIALDREDRKTALKYHISGIRHLFFAVIFKPNHIIKYLFKKLK